MKTEELRESVKLLKEIYQSSNNAENDLKDAKEIVDSCLQHARLRPGLYQKTFMYLNENVIKLLTDAGLKVRYYDDSKIYVIVSWE